MDRVRDLVAAGGVSVVLAQDRDRFAREPAYHYLLRREFEEHGTKLRSLNDHGDESPEGELADGVLDQLAKYERAKTAEKTRRGRLKKAKEGKIVAAAPRPTYGFRFNEARDGYVVDEATMRTVLRVFSMVSEERMSLHSVKRALEADSIPAPNGGRFWNTSTIRGIVLDDCYRPHSYGELEELGSPQVAAALDQSKCYGVCWYNRRRVKTRQVGEDKPEGRRYRRVQQTVWRPRKEWVGVPVPDAGIPRGLVDAAREAIQYNRSSPRGTHFFELSGGVFFCGVCGRRMSPNRRRRSPESQYISYYRCNTRYKRGREACSMGKSLRADLIEPLVWAHVCGMLMDPERLQAGLERLIEEERAQSHGDPDREAREWADRIVAVERKRSGFQDMAAEGLITFDELRVKLAELEEDHETAQGELETLARRQQRIERIEEDAEEVMRSYAGMLPENLRTLDPKERHEVYRILRLRVAAYPDGTLLASGALGKADHVYTPETTSRCCGQSIYHSGLAFSATIAGAAKEVRFKRVAVGSPSLAPGWVCGSSGVERFFGGHRAHLRCEFLTVAWLPLAGLVVVITIQIMRISQVLGQDPLRLGVGEVVAVVVTTRRRRQPSSQSRRLLPDLLLRSRLGFRLRFRLRLRHAAAAYPVSPVVL
jgi:site-specific DNA recombinase